MALNRRKFLTIIGSSAVVLAAGSGAYLTTRTPTNALLPWETAGQGYADARLEALSYAILAPNPHNRQPWLVDLIDDDRVILYCDQDRLLKQTDPFERQITIGLGCFLEVLRMAAAQQGFSVEVTPFPEGYSDQNLDERPVANIRLVEDHAVKPDPLFQQVLNRHTNREAFDNSQFVEGSKLAALEQSRMGESEIHTIGSRKEVAALRELTWNAMSIELHTPNTYLESVELMRIGKAEIEANPDGLSLGTPMLNALYALGMISREEIADPNSSAFQQGIDMLRPSFDTAMAYTWITSKGNSRLDQLDAGAAYVRLHLHATALGLAMQPLSQALQEYSEMDVLFVEIHQMLNIPTGSRIQMLARLGYGRQIDPSPRWPMKSRIR